LLERTIAVTTHGRYLVAVSKRSAPAPLLVGFHGYAESAETQMARLQKIPGAENWTLISIQGLHRFYQRRSDTVIASWMTRQDRELAMADNAAYVAAVVDAEWSASQGRNGVVYAGFSQGVAMAFRAAVHSPQPVLGVVAAGGDVPPEIDRDTLSRVPHVLVCRGSEEAWYTADKFEADQTRLRQAGVVLVKAAVGGGHEWSDEVVAAAAGFLSERRDDRRPPSRRR
jgi:predicted esterase